MQVVTIWEGATEVEVECSFQKQSSFPYNNLTDLLYQAVQAAAFVPCFDCGEIAGHTERGDFGHDSIPSGTFPSSDFQEDMSRHRFSPSIRYPATSRLPQNYVLTLNTPT